MIALGVLFVSTVAALGCVVADHTEVGAELACLVKGRVPSNLGETR